jgi:hypothetical protein
MKNNGQPSSLPSLVAVLSDGTSTRHFDPHEAAFDVMRQVLEASRAQTDRAKRLMCEVEKLVHLRSHSGIHLRSPGT